MTLNEQLDRLAALEPASHPVISLYLNAEPNDRGRDHFQTFVRKELKARAETYPQRSEERAMLDRDLERIASWLQTNVEPSSNGVAIFASDGASLFEAVQLDAPLPHNWLYIGDRPHLYPLARFASQYPRYAAVLASTNKTRILVIAHGGVARDEAIDGVKTKRNSQGGWAQARYQRHIENYHLQHVKEVIGTLEKIVAAEGLDRIVIAGDDVVIPLLREQMPKALAEKVVEELPLDRHAAEADVIARTLEAMRRLDERTDVEKVEAAVGAYRAGGLGVVGSDQTLLALTNGQVDELLVTASIATLDPLRKTPAAEMAIANDETIAKSAVPASATGEPGREEMVKMRLADELIAKAHQTAARVCFIEDPGLLEPYGGVAATLRYRV